MKSIISGNNNFRIVFMGTPEFAVSSLKALITKGYNVVGVITAPDKPTGRGRKVDLSPVKTFALQHNIKVLQPEKLKDPLFIDELKRLNADLQVVVAFRMLPEIVWNMPPKGTFNLHASLLPQYRGAAPINWVIVNGEKETGVTTFFIEKDIDTGKIILQEKVKILENDNAGSLHDKLMIIGAEMVVLTAELIKSGEVSGILQNEMIRPKEILKPAPKIFKNDCRIQWDNDLEKLLLFIRGLSPYPASFAKLKKNTGEEFVIKIVDAGFEKNMIGTIPGTIFSDNKKFLHVAAKNGWISINALQLEGKKLMEVSNFLSGFREISNYSFI